jgi:geranylgeranyl pyrophosphate synthase
VLVAWERANAQERVALQELVKTWQTSSMQGLSKFLTRFETLEASLEIIRQYLAAARRWVDVLPASDGRAGLLGLTEYLARQTEALEVCA